jgi:putative membrane protein
VDSSPRDRCVRLVALLDSAHGQIGYRADGALVILDPRPRLLITWVCNCLALLVAAAVVPAISYGNDFGTLLLAGAILGIANFVLRPLVILLALPAVILSLGVALLFVNALMLWITSLIVPELRVGGFWSTVGGALVIWLVNLALRPSRRPRRVPPDAHGITGRPSY